MARICLQQFFTVCVWVYKQVWNPTHTLPCLLVLHSCLVGEHATTSQSFAQLRSRKQTARTWKTQWFHVQVPQSVPWYSYLRDQIYEDIVGRCSCQWVIIYCNCYLFWAPGRWSSTFMGMGGRIMLVVCQARHPHSRSTSSNLNSQLTFIGAQSILFQCCPCVFYCFCFVYCLSKSNSGFLILIPLNKY